MPRYAISTAMILTVTAVLLAQGPQPGQPTSRVPVPGTGVPLPPPAAPPVVDPTLKAHLDAWEGVMKNSVNFYSECTHVRKNLVRKTEWSYKGSIMCMKPNLARMRLDKLPPPGGKPDPNDYEATISDGRAVYNYEGQAKKVNVVKLQPGGTADNLLLEFMSGNLSANAALTRFDIKLAKEDQHYVYLEIRSKLPKDKLEFEVMTLVLFGPKVQGFTYLPRTAVIRKANGQEEEMWEFPQPVVNAKGIEAKVFEYVAPPKDWKVEQLQAPPAGGTGIPVVRPKTS